MSETPEHGGRSEVILKFLPHEEHILKYHAKDKELMATLDELRGAINLYFSIVAHSKLPDRKPVQP